MHEVLGKNNNLIISFSGRSTQKRDSGEGLKAGACLQTLIFGPKPRPKRLSYADKKHQGIKTFSLRVGPASVIIKPRLG